MVQFFYYGKNYQSIHLRNQRDLLTSAIKKPSFLRALFASSVSPWLKNTEPYFTFTKSKSWKSKLKSVAGDTGFIFMPDGTPFSSTENMAKASASMLR